MEFTVVIAAATPAARAGLRALLHEEGIGVAAALPVEALPEALPMEIELLVIDRGLQPGPLADLLAAIDGAGLVLIGALPHDLRESPPDAGPIALLGGDASGAAIAAAVAAVAAGLRVVDPTLPVEEDPPQSDLTPRELEVLQHLAAGVTNKRLARDLAISENTVKFHVSAVLAKLGAESRTEAVAIAARRGLVAL